MTILFRELRHLNTLVAFEAAARHANFSSAAKELFVTRIAVSRQIKTLEEHLGVTLFQRQHRGVSLTPEGQLLYDSVSTGLRDIAETQHRLRQQRGKQQVSVTMTAAFATYWLIPRSGRFNELYPEIDLRLVISDRYLNLRDEGIDAAIRWGLTGTEGLGVEPLFGGALVPLCSREYLRQAPPISSIADLLGARLIYLEGEYRADAKWPDWFQRNGVAAQSLPDGIVVDSYTNTIQAAVAGQGIALGDVPMLNSLLDEGLLVPAIDVEPIVQDQFYLVRPPGQTSEASDRFCDWLRDEVENGSEKD